MERRELIDNSASKLSSLDFEVVVDTCQSAHAWTLLLLHRKANGTLYRHRGNTELGGDLANAVSFLA